MGGLRTGSISDQCGYQFPNRTYLCVGVSVSGNVLVSSPAVVRVRGLTWRVATLRLCTSTAVLLDWMT